MGRETEKLTDWELIEVRGWEVTPTGCWEYQGSRHVPQDYGIVRHKRAHRVSFAHHRGPIPEGHVVRHLVCDNPPCINPAHLALGTQADNIKDMMAKERYVKGHVYRGETSNSAKLSAAEVEAIREDYLTGLVTQYMLAELYGVSQTQIGRIVKGERWAHMERRRA
jgi:hypothetical protein